MISLAELKRLAGASGVEPRVVDLDYVLGCYLRFLASLTTIQKTWIFKGGTALRKCYFEDYRFSEDLDFTAIGKLSVQDLHLILSSANIAMQEAVGIRTDARELMINVVEDENGRESYEARVYYLGPWNYGGSPRSIEIHVSRDELIIFAPIRRSMIHKYSDKAELPAATIQVYCLEEMMVEKLRALSGQRRQAIPHDIFDLCYLSKKDISLEKVLKAFPDKCQAKGVSYDKISVEKVIMRKAEYESNWRNSLEYLVPHSLKIPFELAWDTVIQLLKKVTQL